MTFKKTLVTANKYSDSFKRLKVSSEKVENVVKPPQKPMVRKILNWVLINSLSSKRKIIRPSRKLPAKLTLNVPYGKVEGKNLYTALDNQ